MKITTTSRSELNVKLGLKENWLQFTLLVIVNAFVGGMVGLERSILPKLAAEEFAITGATAVLSFIVVFVFFLVYFFFNNFIVMVVRGGLFVFVNCFFL